MVTLKESFFFLVWKTNDLKNLKNPFLEYKGSVDDNGTIDANKEHFIFKSVLEILNIFNNMSVIHSGGVTADITSRRWNARSVTEYQSELWAMGMYNKVAFDLFQNSPPEQMYSQLLFSLLEKD